MNPPLGAIGEARFLTEFWQQQPCLIRGAFPDFDPLLDGNDLAGLACEPLAETRLIRGPDAQNEWQQQHGPFDEDLFETVGDRNWTLLVQDVEKHYPPLRALLDRFDFLPAWRLDDLMVSFAAPGGSVGPHVDQYDVFLLQAEGRRQWQIDRAGPWSRRPDVPIDMLADFTAAESWTLEPGDMLYLPPGVAHHGVALDPCLTYSIGFRAPTAADLALALGERLAESERQGGRYRDPAMGATYTGRPGELTGPASDALLALLHHALADSDRMNEFLAQFLSRFRQAHEPVPAPDIGSAEALLATAINEAQTLIRHPWARMCWIEAANDEALLFSSGRKVRCSSALAQKLCGPRPLAPDESLPAGDRLALETLIERGQLLVNEHDA